MADDFMYDFMYNKQIAKNENSPVPFPSPLYIFHILLHLAAYFRIKQDLFPLPYAKAPDGCVKTAPWQLHHPQSRP